MTTTRTPSDVSSRLADARSRSGDRVVRASLDDVADLIERLDATRAVADMFEARALHFEALHAHGGEDYLLDVCSDYRDGAERLRRILDGGR